MTYIQKEAVISPKVLHSGALYSQAIKTGDFIHVSGQIPIEPETKRPVGKTVYEQSCAVLDYIKLILEEAGAVMDDVIKLNCYLADLSDFEEMNRAFETYFTAPYPARITVGVQLIGVLVEMDCVARLGCSSIGGKNNDV